MIVLFYAGCSVIDYNALGCAMSEAAAVDNAETGLVQELMASMPDEDKKAL